MVANASGSWVATKLVSLARDSAGPRASNRCALERVAHLCHECSGSEAVARSISHDEGDVARLELEGIVPIATHLGALAGRPIASGEVKTRTGREGLRKSSGLESLCRLALRLEMQDGFEKVGDMCERFPHRRHILFAEELASPSSHREHGHHRAPGNDGHDESRTVAQELERPTVRGTRHTAVEIIDDLSRQVGEAQRLPASIDDNPGRRSVKGVWIAANQTLSQAVQDWVSVMGSQSNQLLAGGSDDR